MDEYEAEWERDGVTITLNIEGEADDAVPVLTDVSEGIDRVLSNETDEKFIEEVYTDRNLLACAFAVMSPWGGYAPDPENPDEWAIVFGETPHGQVSWHVPMEMVERLNIHERDYEWDGHDRERKNEVLANWTRAGCPY